MYHLRLTFGCVAERALEKDPTRYLLPLEQMIENDYPIPSYMADTFQKPAGWVETPEAPKESLLSSTRKKPKVYAIDCEMVRTRYTSCMSSNRFFQCLTDDGKELTRACIIDYESGIVIYDQLVKPPKPITDYLTRYVHGGLTFPLLYLTVVLAGRALLLKLWRT